MTRYMYDSVSPKGIPATATMVAGYVDGRFENIAQMRDRFPHALVVDIAVSSHTNAGRVLDVEKGDATPTGAVSWVRMRRAAGVNPSVYVARSQWAAVKAAFKTAGVTEPHYWIADWDAVTAIPAGAMAKQFANGAHYDLSSVAAHWPGIDPDPTKPAPKPVPKPPATYTVKKGDTFTSIAKAHKMTLAQLEKLNPSYKGHYNLIYPGDKIHV